ncbi:D-alanyl-D-alanine carboxypeptidase family protein [Actibacterium sp. D379-3]
MATALPMCAVAAPYAAIVIDARTGEVLHSRNADTRLHPASLTKMMTLYIAFEAVENGEISLDTDVRISQKAAAEPPSKLGLRAGQTIKLRYLIRAAAVKSANDAATAIGEAIEGSEAAFARRMNRTATALGMSRTTFKNANGLTEEGHLSTARDMTTLGRHLFFDYPEYYNLFSRVTTDAGIKTVASSNRRFLSSYKGADGIKTGYTRAAGFNLVASAERGNERIIATVFGGRSSASRNAQVAELLDLGFSRAPTRVATRAPNRPAYAGHVGGGGASAGKTIRLVTTVNPAARPRPRPGLTPAAPPEELLVAMQSDIRDAVEQAIAVPEEKVAPDAAPAPKPAPELIAVATAPAPAAPSPVEKMLPKPRPEGLTLASLPQGSDTAQEVVIRVSTSGGRHWGINVGRYNTRYQAERVLLKTALKELGTLDDALRKVNPTSRGFDANFVGMTQDQAAQACLRLTATGTDCTPFGPS